MDVDTRDLIKFLSYKKRIKVFMEKDTLPYVYTLYGSSWIAVLCYVLKFISDDATLIKTIRLLNDSAPKWEDDKRPVEKEKQLFTEILLLNFAPQVQKYFKVPIKIPQLNKNEVLAVFLDFLLQICNSIQAHIYYDEENDDYDDDVEEDDVTAHVPVTHFSHSHSLEPIFKDQIPQNTRCSGCRLRSSATMYTCQSCNFILHPSCAKLPEIATLPCHIGCALSLLFISGYAKSRFYCNACRRWGYGWVYNCKSCKYDLHVSCASKQLKIKHGMFKLNDAIHSEIQLDQIGSSSLNDVAESDQLSGVTNNIDMHQMMDQEVPGPKQLSDESDSVLCKNETIPSLAAAENFDQQSELYEEAWPKKLKHDLHAHRIYLMKRSYYNCDGCDEKGQRWSYYCKKCDFDLHPSCALEGYDGETNEDETWDMELKFLMTSLGDIPFQCCTLPHELLKERLHVLLAEFEIIANQAGHFTLSFILARHPGRFTEFDEATYGLMLKVEHLNENIKQYCITFSDLIAMHVTSCTLVTRPIDSLFIVDSLLEDLENRRLHATVYVDMEDQIEKLYEELKLSRGFLKDTKISRNMPYFSAIREMSYEAEYLINSYVVGYIPIWYFRLRLPVVTQKLNLNRSRLQKIKLDDDVLQITTDFSIETSLQPMEKISIAVAENHLVSNKNSKNEVLAHLTGRGKALKIISLVGMPGLGKTFLTKNLYNSYSVQNHFDARAWCVISQDYQKRSVFIDILMTLISKNEQQKLIDMDDESLGLKIHQSLCKRRYIIIVDDIWSSGTWDDIRRFFPDDNNGSRILLTSRIKSATPSESIFPELQLLSQVDSMNLLVKKVFLNEPCPQHLQGIGNKIAKRCSGLPLAVVAIAGILTNLDRTENAWEKVEKDLGMFMLDVEDGCAKVLEFSYEHLPDHLKMCFIYLGTFSEDSGIAVNQILRLWIAEGFIERVQGKSPNDAAREYLHDLINRSLVLIVERKFDGAIKACGLHDLLRDLCLRKADETGFMKSTKMPFSMYVRHHRLHVDCDKLSLSSHFGLHCCSFSGKNQSVASSCFSQMPLHRVINLFRTEAADYETSDIQQLEGIDMLAHLRYLHAPGQRFLAQSASNLVNLEVLCVSHFRDDKIALSILLKMVNLKYLKTINSFTNILNDCKDSCKSSNLQFLSAIEICSLGDEECLEYFPHLKKLRIGLSHSRFPDIGFTVLESLIIDNFSDVKIDFSTVVFPASIRKLILHKMGMSWDQMSVIGKLPNLQVLNLCWDAFVGEEWKTRDDEFQKLRFLKLYKINDLKQWVTCSEHFPELQHLGVDGCDKLTDIPSDLGNIPTLHRIEVIECSYIVSKSAVRIEEEQHEMGNEELEVIISNSYWYKLDLVRVYKKMKQVFSQLDDDSELVSVMRSIGINPSEAEIQKMIETMEFSDFLDRIAEIRVPFSDHMIQKAFNFFDRRHKSGLLDISNLYEGLRELDQEISRDKLEKMMRKADIDGDRLLNQDDFKKLMMTIDVPRPYDLTTFLMLLKMPGENDDGFEDAKDFFDMFDFDGDGWININEMIHLVSIVENPTDAQIDDMMNKVDLNDNGTIDFSQFLYLYEITFCEETYKESFEYFDEDHNGFISAADLHKKTLHGKEVTDEMIRECDIDGDGQLNYHEFIMLYIKLALH